MTVVRWVLPPLPAGLARSKAEKRKPKDSRRGPVGKQHGKHTTVPDEVVAGIRWMRQEGFPTQAIRLAYPGVTANYIGLVYDEIVRAHILPRCPPFISETFWRQRHSWRTSVELPVEHKHEQESHS